MTVGILKIKYTVRKIIMINVFHILLLPDFQKHNTVTDSFLTLQDELFQSLYNSEQYIGSIAYIYI